MHAPPAQIFPPTLGGDQCPNIYPDHILKWSFLRCVPVKKNADSTCHLNVEKRKCPQGSSYLDPFSKSLDKLGSQPLLQNLKGRVLHPSRPSWGLLLLQPQTPVTPALALNPTRSVSVNGPCSGLSRVLSSQRRKLFAWVTFPVTVLWLI